MLYDFPAKARLIFLHQKYEELNKALQEFEYLKIADQFDFQKLYLYSIITHSTAIEGSTVSEAENALMFDEGIVPGGHNVIEQMMNLDLKRAYDYVISILNKKPAITVDFLKHLSSLVMRNTGSEYSTSLGSFDSSAGDLRLLNVSAGRGGKSYLSFQKIPQRLEDFCKWLNNERDKWFPDAATVYAISFEAHYRLVSIHPWVDGNGRICRLLMNMIQMEQGVLPSILKKENKAKYIEALAESQDKGNSSIFIEFMMDSMLDFIKESIHEYNKSNTCMSSFRNNNDIINDKLRISLDGLSMALERFEKYGSFASCGDWIIKRNTSTSSTLWTAYYQEVPVVSCISNDDYDIVKRLTDMMDMTFSNICNVAHSVFPRCRMDLEEQKTIKEKGKSAGR